MRSDYMRLCVSVALLSLAIGCGQSKEQTSDSPSEAAASKAAETVADASGCVNPPQDMTGPAGAVYRFFTAFRSGDDVTTEAMLTELARNEIKKHKRTVAPPANDSAQFEIGQVEMLDDQRARVSAKLTDVKDGKRFTDETTLVLRNEADGWRVAGMVANVFPGEPPLLLDFEDLEETLAKMTKLQAEIARRNGQQQESDSPAPEGDAVAADTPAMAPGNDNPPAATPDGQQPDAAAQKTPADNAVAAPGDATPDAKPTQQAEKPADGTIR